MEKTAVEWLIEQIDERNNIINSETDYITKCTMISYGYGDLYKEAMEMQHEQTKNAQMDMFYHCNDKDYGMQYLIARELAEQFADDYSQAMPLPMPTESKAIPVLSDEEQLKKKL